MYFLGLNPRTNQNSINNQQINITQIEDNNQNQPMNQHSLHQKQRSQSVQKFKNSRLGPDIYIYIRIR